MPFAFFYYHSQGETGLHTPAPFPLVHPLYHGFAIALNINLCQRALGRSSRLCPRTQIQYAAPPCAAVFCIYVFFEIFLLLNLN